MRSIYFFGLLLSFSLVASCTPEDKTPSKETLAGDWKLVSSTRDGQATTTLGDLSFNFSTDGQMTSNLFPLLNADLTMPFEVHEHEIVSSSNEELRFNIKELNDDPAYGELLPTLVSTLIFDFYVWISYSPRL